MKMKWIVLSILLFLPLMALAETTVVFEPSQVALGESTELIIETDRPLAQEPDLSGLEGNFAISGTQQSVKTVSVNGRRRTRYRLSFNVFPRKEGELSTGAMVINNQSVKPAVLMVDPAGTNSRLPITFTATTSQSVAYPDEAFLFKIKLTYGVALLNAKIMPPTVENASITQLDMDKTYQETQDGRPVYVFERTFSVTANQSGYLTIPPVEVYGLVSENGNADLFSGNILFDGLLGGQKEVRLESNPIQMTILEKPTDWKGWWLPSTQVSMTSDDTFPEQIKVGDSLTRTIKLTALGVEAEKLPIPKQPIIDGFKIYPSPEQRETIQTPVGDIQGILTLSYVLVPVSAGDTTIPEIRVPWFNTRTRRAEWATLPSKKIQVLAGMGQQVSPKPHSSTPHKSVHKKTSSQKNTPDSKETTESAPQKSKLPWGWIMTSSGVALCFGLGLGFILFRRWHHSYRIRDKVPSPKKKKKPLPDLYPF
ncbi:MAG: BatD family protein [Pseudomonadota bacterium]|nr:BatD family protein [Pseudomonadota bacterium]